MIFSGSVRMFSNEAFLLEGYGNEKFCIELSKWALGEKSVLRVFGVRHHRVDGSEAEHLLNNKQKPDLPFSLYSEPEIAKQSLVYRIKDDIVYSIIIEEYYDNEWHPYVADDVQLEFVMLDPYIRTFLETDGSGKFSTHLVVPDQHGF